jgi:hypothetical protein
MKSKPRLFRVLLTVTLVFILAGAPLAPQPAQASYEDAAIFYDELAHHGSWVDYEKYGPVWYPSQVENDWRPYTNGRWTPSEQGYLFETDEPWGWATYHYGNWMPTEHYGWVWVPGRTWYPNTVAWRHSPEDTPRDLAYIGWAPIPPPNYAPQPGLYGGYGGYSGYSGYSGYPGGGGGMLDLISAPFWIFAQATRFLLGFGQPYTPAYSYYGSGILAPPTYVQAIYPVTTVVRTWHYPSYYQPSYFGSGTALGAYSWGPPTRYVSHVTNINYVTINNYKRRVHVNNVRGGWPDTAVFKRNAHLRRIVPSENPRNWSRPMEVRNVQAAARHLGNPRAIVKPADLRPLPSGRIPKAGAVTAERRPQRRVFEVPQRAQQRFTPQMSERIRSLRPASEGSAGQGRGPGRPQTGFVGGPDDPRRRGGQPEGFQGPRGDRRGPGAGAEGFQGTRRGPAEDFQRPGSQDVRRGPAATPATRATPAVSGGPGTRATRAVPATPATPATQGMRRGPVEGDRRPEGLGVRRGPSGEPEPIQGVRRGPAEDFQRRGSQDVRRGPAATPATRATPAVPGGPGTRATRAVPATPATPATPPSPQGMRRGPGEGFQAPEQSRRQQVQPQQIRQLQEQQQRQRREPQSPRQLEPQQRLQQQQMQRQQEEQRRQQLQSQQIRQQQEQRQRQQQQLEQQRRQQVQPQQVRQQQEQLRRQPRQSQQIRQQPDRQPRAGPQPQQVRQEQKQPRRQQVRPQQEADSREQRRQPRTPDQRTQRPSWGQR